MVEVVLAAYILVHSWFPIECCGGGDCAKIDPSRVKVTSTGYLIDGKYERPFQSPFSPDENYYACFPHGGALGCFWVPRPST